MSGPTGAAANAPASIRRRETMREALRRLSPVFLLLVLAPLVAEYLSGSLAMSQLSALPVMIFLYGAGAVLIREAVRRTGRGYAAILFLALAYGLLEEGIWDQSLFNPHFNGLHLLDYGFVSALGLALPWTLYVLSIHVIWSICVPIALVEGLFRRGTEPWLRTPGLIVVSVLYVLGAWAVFFFSAKGQHFMASPVQLGASAAAAAVCLVLAFLMPRRRPQTASPSARPWLLTGLGFVGSSAFVLLYGQGANTLHLPWLVAGGGMAILISVTLFLFFRSGRRSSWPESHVAAVAGGALLTYCWVGFSTEPELHPGSTVLPRAILVAAMIGLLVTIAVRAYRQVKP